MRSKVWKTAALRLSSWTGDAGRSSEIRDHLAQAEANGNPVGLADVASLGTLVARRAVRDIPWWLAGLPVALVVVLLLAHTYEEHFWAWDVVGVAEYPRTELTQRWVLATNLMFIIATVAALVAGRVVVQQLRQRRVVGPLTLLAILVVALSQTDLFIERTAWWRDGRLKPEHVNDVSGYSLVLFFAFALIPFVYIGGFVVSSRVPRERRAVRQAEPTSDLDSAALAAVGLPLLVVLGGWLLILPTVIFTWAARSFSTRLKIVTTVVVSAPIVTAFVWTTVLSFEIDDGHPVVWFGMLGLLFAVWARMAAVALRPLRGVRLRLSIEQPS